MRNQTGLFFQINRAHGGAAGRILTAALLFLGLAACIWDGLGLAETGCTPLPLFAVGVLYCAAACRLPKGALVFQAAAAVVLAVYAVLVSRYIVNGWNVTMNAVFQVLELRLGYIFPRYEVAASTLSPALCAGLFLALPTVLLGLLCAKAVCGRGLWMAFVAMLLAGLLLLGAFNLYPPDAWWALLLLGLAAVSVQRRNRACVTPAGLRQTAAALLAAALILSLCAIPALVWNGGGTARALSNRRAAERFIHRLRYEEEETTLPEGAFQSLSDFAPAETTALTVSMEKPQELYLRGYVGESYTGSGWAELAPARRAKYATLFSWLHKRGFYGQEQYALLGQTLGIAGGGSEVSLTLQDACTGWQYAPYGLTAYAPNPRQIGDADLPADGLHGKTELAYALSGASIGEYETLAALLTEARKRGDAAALDYLASENAYREFVYACYLEVPETARAALAQVLSGLELPKVGRVSFSDAQLAVRAYLSSIVTYCEEPAAIPENEDFLTAFLLETREGYSVHYATAAALMFRYLGIPARYVEGFYLPAEAAAEIEPGEPTALSQSFAHAWVEIYRDGVGFVPFEITPPYTDPMEQSNRAPGGSGGAELPPEEEPESTLTPWQLALRFLWGLLALALLLILGVVLRRQVKRQRRQKLLEAADPSRAVSNMTTWALRLLACLGVRYAGGSLLELQPQAAEVLGAELAAQYRAVVLLQQRALFSRDGVEDKDRAAPRALLRRLEAELKQRSSWTERLRLRWVLCML